MTRCDSRDVATRQRRHAVQDETHELGLPRHAGLGEHRAQMRAGRVAADGQLHRRLVEGTAALGDPGTATIDRDRRKAISRAHSATHMIHKALQESLGKDATQAGSENAPSRIRFDFRRSSAVPAGALSEIEERVNTQLQENLEVTDQLMPITEARALGAMALFGEKYGDRVRVVSVGGEWSKELCGGTHVSRSGEIGRVTLLGEASIGSGIRRIDALVGQGAYEFHAREHAMVGNGARDRPHDVERIEGWHPCARFGDVEARI